MTTRAFIEDFVSEYTHDEEGNEVVFMTDVINIVEKMKCCGNCYKREECSCNNGTWVCHDWKIKS